jgi:hypothetical protein
MVADCPPAPRAEIRLAAQNAQLGTASVLIGIWSTFVQAARRAFSLSYPITERDAADRCSPMPTLDSVWRDCPGGRRRATCPSMLPTNGPAAIG